MANVRQSLPESFAFAEFLGNFRVLIAASSLFSAYVDSHRRIIPEIYAGTAKLLRKSTEVFSFMCFSCPLNWETSNA